MFEILAGSVSLVLLVVGFLVGSTVERQHFRSLSRREGQLAHILRTNLKAVSHDAPVACAEYVDGQAVIGSDYFKTFASRMRNIFGGELRSFERLMARARREAIVRMLEKADKLGASVVLNIRLETSTIGRGKGKHGLPTAEIHAYGTAVAYRSEHD